MNARSTFGAACLASALFALSGLSSARAGGHGGAVFQAGGGWHGGGMSHVGGGRWGAGSRGLPPLSGVIHERAGLRPYFSPYGHTSTMVRLGGHLAAALAAGRYGVSGRAGTGHVDTEVHAGHRGGIYRADRGSYGGGGRQRFAGRHGRFGAQRVAFLYGGYGGYGGYAGYGGSVDQGGGEAGQGSPVVYDGGYGDGSAAAPTLHYATETPLAARFGEPPLAPSPYGGGDDYAYAASNDVGFGGGPRIVRVRPPARSDCGCGPRAHAAPVVYRYGVGTAY